MDVRTDSALAYSDFARQNLAAEADRRHDDLRKLQRVQDTKRAENGTERDRTVGRYLNAKA